MISSLNVPKCLSTPRKPLVRRATPPCLKTFTHKFMCDHKTACPACTQTSTAAMVGNYSIHVNVKIIRPLWLNQAKQKLWVEVFLVLDSGHFTLSRLTLNVSTSCRGCSVCYVVFTIEFTSSDQGFRTSQLLSASPRPDLCFLRTVFVLNSLKDKNSRSFVHKAIKMAGYLVHPLED